mmetsp:Transcript_20201/g.51144  ORF Transcript_20201/g.51144 Transcript_20201/m.51144 type:complete len:209 (-) Transcript_20201:131-757(-)
MLTRTGTDRVDPLGWNCRPELLPRSTSPSAGFRLGATDRPSDRPEHTLVTVTSTMPWWFSRSVSFPPLSTATTSGFEVLKLTRSARGNQSRVPESAVLVNWVPSLNVSATAVGVVESRRAAKLYGEAEPPARSTTEATPTLVSLTSTVCAVVWPSKVAVSVVVPALCARSREASSEATVVSLELNVLCVVTVNSDESERFTSRLAAAC